MSDSTNERIKFRLIRAPCCSTLLCWVNPRLPNYCPECGKSILARLRLDGASILQTDENAWLKVTTNPNPRKETTNPNPRKETT